MTSNLSRTVLTIRIMAWIGLMLVTYTASGVQEDRFCAVHFKDSLIADQQTRILYNNVSIANSGNQPATFDVALSIPPGWRLLSDEHVTVTLVPGEKQILPLAFIKLPGVVSAWQPVSLRILPGNSRDTLHYVFHIKAAPVSRFRVTSGVQNIEITGRDDEAKVPLKITNAGSVGGVYTITWKCTGLEIDDRILLYLPAHTDTNYVYLIHVPSGLWSTFKSDKLNLRITDSAGNVFNYSFKLNRVGNELKQHLSGYDTFPLTLQAGVLNSGTMVSYFGALHGEVAIDTDSKVSFSYRSKQIGLYNQFQRNIWSIEYLHKRWLLYGGTITDARYFPVYNTGAKVIYKWKTNGELSFYGSIHEHQNYSYGYFSNDNMTASLKYGLGKMILTHDLSTNFDAAQRLNSYLNWNTVRIINRTNTRLEINAGAGMDQSTYHFTGNSGELWGYAAGYLFTFNEKKWSIMSNMQNNDDNYPGLKKGLRLQIHNISRQLGKLRLGVFYESNFSRSNYFRDTVYRTDVFITNATKYGLRTGWSAGRMSTGLSLGMVNEEGRTNAIGPKYPFADLTYSFHTKGFRMMLRSLTGYTDKNGDVNEDIYVTNSSANFFYRFVGFQGFYIRTPIVHPEQKSKPIEGFNETMTYMPYVNVRIGKNFTGQLQYNISRSVFDHSTLSFIGGNFTYKDDPRGMTIDLYANIPLQENSEIIHGLNRQYASLTISKRINMPEVTRRKYYNLEVIAFYDENSNGIMDHDEKRIPNIEIDVSDVPFITDNEGRMIYENVERGLYTIDLHNVRNLKGLIPSAGFTQKVMVNGNTTVMLAYKKSRVISGHIRVLLDSLSPARFTADFLKVTATDTSGNSFVTASDANSDFFFSLPAGIYSLSLNPRAFSDNLKPFRMSYKIDLVKNNEAIVIFEIDQKNREVRLKNYDMNTH